MGLPVFAYFAVVVILLGVLRTAANADRDEIRWLREARQQRSRPRC